MKNKKILIGVTIAVSVMILIITGICIFVSRGRNGMSISTPELARMRNYEQFEEGDDAIDNTDNVKFSAFFLRDLDGDGYAEKIKGTCKKIGEEDTLYMEINVLTSGYLKDAKVEIAGQNFYLQTALPKDEQLKDNYIGNNIKTIEFNQLNNGTQKLFTGKVKYSESKNINNYSRTDNKIILTGTYVSEDGTETAISKEIDLTMDWYGTTKATISSTSQTYSNLPDRIDEENGTVKLNFTVNSNETDSMLILSKNHVEGIIPELNGYTPTQVSMTNSTSANLIFTYDEETRKFTIDRTATVGEDGKITTSVARNNSYGIEVIYPIEAYQVGGEETVSIKIPVKTYYEGYNNPNTEFRNPYKSNVASTTIIANYSNPKGTVANFSITVGKNVYSPRSRYLISKEKPLKIYNGASEEEKEDTYLVKWSAYTGTDGETTGLVMKETKEGQTQVADEFIKTDASTDSMENVTTNIGIYFTGADNILKEDGWIKVYDEETGDLLVTLTKDNWNTYTSSNPYKYELPVKHIRVETSETNAESSLYVYNIKELNDEYITTNYTKEEFDNLQYIKSTLNGYLGGEHVATRTHQANYETPYSVATISLSNSEISTQLTEENEKITITANYDSSANQVGWVNGSFLVKLPQEILAVEVNSVNISNSAVSISTWEVIENDEGTFIKINTKNNNETQQSYNITIDANITPDPRLASSTKNIELYASNSEVVEYYYGSTDTYDVNDNLNTTEIVNKTSTTINLIAPSSLLTNQTASEYDSSNNITVAPQIAEITPLYAKVDNEKQTAKIGLQVKNNYASTISEVAILGKIPFEGNTTVISGKDLNSEFTTKMINTGIEIPQELQGKITVYYSENETPDKDISNEANGWKMAENITNWDNIKTFLIDFQDEIIPQGKEYNFYYKVEIPEGVEFNKELYSHHGVYFCLDTDEGKYRTQTEPNKLGFRIAEKYNLEIIKTQTGKDKVVSGATYSVKEIAEDGTEVTTKTAVTNEQGTLIIENLYAERTYEIQEIKSPNDYELNSDIIRFIGHVAEDGTLTIEKTQGTTKEDITVTKNEGEKHKATVKVEDEAKAKLKITKKEQGTETVISSVKYKLTGAGLQSSGRILTTNVNGEATISGLKINGEYTLEETKATGYYLAEPVKFKIVNNEGTYELQITEGIVLSNTVTEEDSLPIINLTLEDEKIPRYTLEISKIKKTLETELETEQTEENTTEEQEVVYLEGAKFKLYKGAEEIGEYTTDVNGKIIINDLYQYVDGKDEEAVYTLKEVLAPDGYAKVKDITFKVQEVDGTLKLINTSGEEEKYTVDGTTIKLTIEDSPSFKLIKKDAETGAVLANVKFAIYNVDDGQVPATNSKGEIIGTKEIINGREYYTVTTDENGIITADLTEGFYKAVEVQAPDKYDIENSTYYFGIGGSREGKRATS